MLRGYAILGRMFSVRLIEKVMFEQNLKEVSELAMRTSGGRAFQVKPVQSF